MTQRYIVSHTSIRGIAALLVVFYHLQFGVTAYFPWEKATPFFKTGYLWVDLFFILSGFVISYSARLDERAPYSWSYIKSFWVTRFARIYPLHIVTLFALLGVNICQYVVLSITHRGLVDSERWSPLSLLNFVEQIFLLNGWGLTGRVGWNIPSWSISAEMFAYLLFPLFAAAVARMRIGALVVMALVAVTFYAWVGLTTGVLDIVKGMAMLRCVAGFSLGMLIYATRGRFEHLSGTTLGALQLVGVVLAVGTLLLGLNDVIAIPGFFLLVAATWPDRGWLANMLKSGVLHWLGEISYSIYLNHFWVISAWHFGSDRVLRLLGASPLTIRAASMVGSVTLTLLVSHFTFRYIEGPARRAIVDWYRGRTTTPPTSTLQAENSLT